MITISAFKWVPDFAQGQVRDLRARWALEEAGLPYKTRLLEQGDQDKPDYRALQPFGQVPILEEDGLVLFESGAIVLHIGERSETLLPKDAGARARATQWLIAALNSIEPFVMNVALIDLFYANEEWAKLRRPGAVEFVQKRLSALSKSLGDKPYLDGDRFTAGDLMMTTVLRILKHTDIVTSDKRLAAYVERCTARPAFKRAFDAQIGDFRTGCIARSSHRRDPAVLIQQSCKAKGQAMRKNTICLWYDKDAEAAARFYAATFPDSAVSAVLHAPSDYPGGKKGDVLTVDFTVLGIPCLGLNGGPMFKHNEAFSFQIATDDQAETDRYWNAIVGNGGQESQCGWCKDKWGISWQITPRVLTDALAAGGDEAKRAFDAMMEMKKIDVAAIEAARRG